MADSTLIIAEAGVNHNGDIETAKRLIDAAKSAGADLIKFQTFNAERQVTPMVGKAEYQLQTTSKEENQLEMLARLELTEEMHQELLGYCNDVGIGFFSTGFDIGSVDFLYSMGIRLFKIPSGEITNLPYLRHIGTLDSDIILSTGMATLGEIESALDVLMTAGASQERISVLHCTSQYPTPMEEVNLAAMANIGAAFNLSFGYSDHTVGLEVSIAAVALGATIIEKHFTLDRMMEGPDHRCSLEPNELRNLVSAIRNIEVALGDGIKRVSKSEKQNQKISRKSIVSCREIKVGEIFTNQNLTTMRSIDGISPMQWDLVVGKMSNKNIAAKTGIELKFIKQ